MEIANQGVIITGAASGMGLAVAERLTQLGAKIVLLDINESLVNQEAKRLKQQARVVDVSSETSVDALFEELKVLLPNLRICINCAGIAPAKRIVGKQGAMPLEEFRKVIDINLVGTFNVMRKAAEWMSQEKLLGEERGVIINTASIAAFEGQLGQAAYAASKGGVISLTLPAARELAAHAIRVMAIAPGLVDTPMMRNMSPAVQDGLKEQIPFPKRFIQPEEFARVVVEIIENGGLNGGVIRLDAALRMV